MAPHSRTGWMRYADASHRRTERVRDALGMASHAPESRP